MGLLIFVIIGSIMAIAGLVYISFVANKILQRMMEEESDEEESNKLKNEE